MASTPGSFTWLMRHELRLYWRSGVFKSASSIFMVVILLLLQLIALAIAFAVRKSAISHESSIVLLTAGIGVAFLLMLSRSITSVVQTLYTRGDMDLLLSSPLAPEAIITVRSLAIAFAVTMEVAILAGPLANAFMLFGSFQWAKAYILLPALGLLVTTAGLFITLWLFRLLGPRRTQVAAQVMAGLIGLSVTMLGWLPSMARQKSSLFTPGIDAVRQADPSLSNAVWIPARQIIDGVAPTLLMSAACVVLFVVTMKLVGTRFMQATTLLAGSSARTSTHQRGGVLRFRGNARVIIILKELRLIRRDPWLLIQLLQQVIYIVPMVLIMWRQHGGTGTPWSWLALILVVSSLAGALSWLTVCAEDAPDLLAASPLSTASIVRTKVEAALLPLLPLVLAPLVLWRTHLWFALCVMLCSLGSGITCALFQIRNPVARKRGDFKTRYKSGSGFIELAIVAVWILLCAILAWWSPFGS